MSPVITNATPLPIVVDFAQVLTAAGQTVAGDDGWRNRTHPGTFTPVGVLWHHTGGDNALDVVINGRADLAGPLCNLYLDREGSWWPVAAGVAWHAGPGSQTVLDELSTGQAPLGDAAARGLVDDCDTGNEHLIGIEVEWAQGQDWPQVQINALVAGTAALLDHLGLNANHCRHHRQWTARKQDMAYTGDLWAAVTATLEGSMPLSAADLTAIAKLIKAAQDTTITHIRDDQTRGIAAVKAEVDAIKAKLGA